MYDKILVAKDGTVLSIILYHTCKYCTVLYCTGRYDFVACTNCQVYRIEDCGYFESCWMMRCVLRTMRCVLRIIARVRTEKGNGFGHLAKTTRGGLPIGSHGLTHRTTFFAHQKADDNGGILNNLTRESPNKSKGKTGVSRITTEKDE